MLALSKLLAGLTLDMAERFPLIAAVLLGSGVRLFDRLAGTPLVLGNPTVIAGDGVAHLRYRVRKP